MIPVHVIFHQLSKKEDCILSMLAVPLTGHTIRIDDRQWRVVSVRWECQSGHDTYTPVVLLAETTSEW
jgi:hypothetical protein